MKCNDENPNSFNGVAFSGGGAKGVGHLGVVSALGDKGLNRLTEVSGASAGSIIGLCVALGMTSTEIINFSKEQKIELKQNILKEQIQNLITKKLESIDPDMNKDEAKELTFSQLSKIRDKKPDKDIKDLKIAASWVSKSHNIKQEICLSNESAPHMPIYLAVLASAALPLVMDRVKIAERDYCNYFEDGIKEVLKEITVIVCIQFFT